MLVVMPPAASAHAILTGREPMKTTTVTKGQPFGAASTRKLRHILRLHTFEIDEIDDSYEGSTLGHGFDS